MLLFDAPAPRRTTPVETPPPAAAPPRAQVLRRRALLLGGCALAALAGLALGDPAPRLAADPETATLLRGMAAIKAVLLLGALALLAWRLGKPLPARIAAIYIVGAAVMAFATALIAQLTALPLAALAFHAAEITLLVTAWRDLR